MAQEMVREITIPSSVRTHPDVIEEQQETGGPSSFPSTSSSPIVAVAVTQATSSMTPMHVASAGHNYSQVPDTRGEEEVITESPRFDNEDPPLGHPEEQVNSDDVGHTDHDAAESHVFLTPDGQDSGNILESDQVFMTTATGDVVEMGLEGPACLICGDRASGNHYSVYSCEGCKGFFKRTVQKNLTYSCREHQDCIINKYTRNNCQYCRFAKCLNVGMKKEGVREDRTPGGKHRQKRPRLDGGPSIPSPITALEADDHTLIEKVIDARPNLIPGTNEIFPDHGTSGTRDMTDMDINDLMQYGYMELRMIIEWARKVPGFSELLIEDQMALLKASFMELNVLRLAFRSLGTEGKVKFAEGVELDVEKSRDIGWGNDLIRYTTEFINMLKEISIDLTEYCILNAIVLTYPDAAGAQDKDNIFQLQTKFLEILRKYSLHTYPSDPRRYARLLLRIPALRSVSAKAAERFLSMSLDGSIKMNSLVLEMMS